MLAKFEDLPAPLQSIRSRPLFVMRLNILPYQIVGGPKGAFRRVGVVPGGVFEGSRISGKVLPGANDWQIVRADGSNTLEVKLVLEADDGATIAMSYKGIRHGPPDVLDRLNRGEDVDPSRYYFRTNPVFETDSTHDWLNGILAIGVGYRTPEGVIYSLFEIL